MWLFVVSHVSEQRDRQDLISLWRLDLHSLVCPNHLNSVYSPSPGFSICWVGQAPYPSGEQPVCFWEGISQRELRLMVPAPRGEVGQAGGEGATRLNSIYLFIFLVGIGSGLMV